MIISLGRTTLVGAPPISRNQVFVEPNEDERDAPLANRIVRLPVVSFPPRGVQPDRMTYDASRVHQFFSERTQAYGAVQTKQTAIVFAAVAGVGAAICIGFAVGVAAIPLIALSAALAFYYVTRGFVAVVDARRSQETARALCLLVQADQDLNLSNPMLYRGSALDALMEANRCSEVRGRQDVRLHAPLRQFAARLNETFDDVF